ncbi:hypothetical protein INR75_08930 [Zunongwangia sp. SCSIO 43204]|uniref:hypothetical protein n=1 Tax=Zunongwangia sp. SCSIO 43204 TaxID=2779359 RepID=UPI001CA99969|nr:hypothetical protein [Zunongwangia sp. SCSIO 43204]UAB86101.1 hypothetical protein INR75_08930 [Zunongwangia sp. SCSIO 43204]
MRLKIRFIILLSLVVLGSSFGYFYTEVDAEKIELINDQDRYTAGEKIQLKFNNIDERCKLYLHHSYSQSILKPEIAENQATFLIPDFLSAKSGEVNWILLKDEEQLQTGSFEILPKVASKTVIESYFGPRSIQAGDRDYSMLVVVPMDAMDNPLPDSTSVMLHKQFYEEIDSVEIFTDKLMAWRNIMAYRKTGNINVSSTVLGVNSIELTTNVFPSNATDFQISSFRNHDFADGNQIAEFTTSEIKDEWGNTISDGTLVSFYIENEAGTMLTTRGSSIEGVATAKIIHPDHPDTWKIKGYVTGLAESNEIEISFRQALKDFEVEFSNGNRTIKIGPLQSFMQQLIPDGAVVKLHIFHQNKLVEIKQETSNDGFVTFRLTKSFYPENSYSFKIEALGKSKTTEELSYEE